MSELGTTVPRYWRTRSGCSRTARALILTPTRELAAQIGDNFRAYGRHLHLRHTLVFGGVGHKPQIDALTRGVDILIATPGRLLDHINQRVVRLDQLEVLVLDEADRMFDMGFIRDVRRIVSMVAKERQTLGEALARELRPLPLDAVLALVEAGIQSNRLTDALVSATAFCRALLEMQQQARSGVSHAAERLTDSR